MDPVSRKISNFLSYLKKFYQLGRNLWLISKGSVLAFVRHGSGCQQNPKAIIKYESNRTKCWKTTNKNAENDRFLQQHPTRWGLGGVLSRIRTEKKVKNLQQYKSRPGQVTTVSEQLTIQTFWKLLQSSQSERNVSQGWWASWSPP